MAERWGISEAPTRKPRPKSAKQMATEHHPHPTLTILAHPHPLRIGERMILRELSYGKPVLLSRREPGFKRPGGHTEVPLNDPYLSRSPIIFSPVGTRQFRLDQATSGTSVLVNGSPLRGSQVFSWDEITAGIRLQLSERILLLFHFAKRDPKPGDNSLGLVGQSDAMIEVREEVRRIQDLDTPILLRGSSGTGKELVASAIHHIAPGKRPFVSVNMSAIPPSLAAAELFGATKGSYTGSDRPQTGFFKAAHGGTLFLDEIGETPLEVQAMLLRALETGEIQSVGSQAVQKVQVRLIAATDADLESKMEDQAFRAPLFHRLSGYVIYLPTLKDRPDDIGRLFIHFAREELTKLGALHVLSPGDPDFEPWLSPELMEQLVCFDWPGNVRQLRNVVRQLIIGSRDKRQLVLTQAVRDLLGPKEPMPQIPTRPKSLKPSEITEELLIQKLRSHRWDIKATAVDLGISRGSLYALIEKTPSLKKASELSADDIQAALDKYGNDYSSAANSLCVSLRALRRRMFELNLSVKSANDTH